MITMWNGEKILVSVPAPSEKHGTAMSATKQGSRADMIADTTENAYGRLFPVHLVRSL